MLTTYPSDYFYINMRKPTIREWTFVEIKGHFFMWFHKRPSYPCLIQVEEASFKRSWNTLRYLTPAIAVSVMYDIASKKHSFTQTYASEYVI